jgi:hypothetical protein
MTRAEKLKALQEIDYLIERAGSLCASYELGDYGDCRESESGV